jgi:hypothetical protein
MTPGPERRQARRRETFDEHGVASARVRPGRDVALVNVSARGALIEAEHRLLPGSSIELQLTAGARSATVRARVLRCSVARLRASSISYRGAVGFDRDLPWFVDGDEAGYSVPGADTPVPRGWGAATRVPL